MEFERLVSQNYTTAEPATRAGKLRSRLENDTTNAVLVEGDDVIGAVLARDLLRSRVSDDAEAQTLVDTVPAIGWGTDIREIARLLVENDTTIAPVRDDGTLHGVVTRDGILQQVLDDLSAIEVGDVHTDDPLTVPPDATMGNVINDLRENGISRLPVVDDGSLVGIATTDDLIEFVVRGTDTAKRGDRGGDKPHLIELPVENVMSRPAETAAPDESVQSAVETMFEKGYDGLVVSDESMDEDVLGILTKTDVLRALTYTASSRIDVQVTNPEYIRTTDRTEIAERIEDIVDKYEELDVMHVHVTFQQHDEEHRGEPLIRCQARLFTDQSQLAGTGEGYGGGNALSLALDKLERNVLELKGKQSETAQRQQVLEKLQKI